MTESELADIEAAAAHEASHAVLVRKFGGMAQPEIWRAPDWSVGPLGRRWIGTCRILASPGDLRIDTGVKRLIGTVRTPQHWRVYVGLAGYLGEALFLSE